MNTRFMLQRVVGGVSVIAIGAPAEPGGLKALMLAAAAFALAAWVVAMLSRGRIFAAFPQPT